MGVLRELIKGLKGSSFELVDGRGLWVTFGVFFLKI